MRVKPGSHVSLKDFDPGDTASFRSPADVDDTLGKLQKELNKLQYLFFADARYALLIVLQGMDTAGKDGTIRHVLSSVSPLGVQVTAFKTPTEREREHDFLWRVHQVVPRFGHIGIFNRSHYEDVLVVRVHEMVPRKVWKARYEQINDFEKMLARNRVVILKFFLHISKDEQKRRLEERLHDPTRYWKFALSDVEERKFWADYRKAYEDALDKCSTKWAPWHIVPADNKWYRNLVVAETIVDTLRGLDLKFPEPSIDLSKIVIE